MKKQIMKTKLSLNKFKIAKISDFGKSKIYGGDGDENGTDNGTSDSIIKDGTLGGITNATK